MSFVENGDDELDYGEGEIGEGGVPVAVTASFEPGVGVADEDEMTHEEDYEDLYDDVNIGFFQAPAEPARDLGDGDGFSMENDNYEQKPASMPAKKVPVSVPFPATNSTAKEISEQVTRGMSASWSTQDDSYRSSIQSKDSIAPVNVKNPEPSAVQHPKQFSAYPARQQGDLFNSGARAAETSSEFQYEKLYSPKTAGGMSTEPTSTLSQKGMGTLNIASAGPSVQVGQSSMIDRSGGVVDDMSHEKVKAIPSGANKVVQRDVSPTMDASYRQSMANDNTSRQMNHQQYTGDGSTMLFVGDLHWWTTDAELEAALSDYGRVKNLKFFEERVSGKSKGYCQVEFFDPAAALACKQGMNGRKFHDRPCIVAIGNAKSIQQMGYQQEKKTQAQMQAQQDQMAARRNAGNSGGRGNYQEREGGRGYGRMGAGRSGHNQGTGKSGQSGGARGKGNYMGKGGGGSGTGMPYGQGHSGPMGGHQSAMMMHQGMMGQGYDPAYGPMGRGGAAYGGYMMPGPPFSGMVGPFPGLGPGGLPGVAPHVNPAFFGRSVGPGMMSGSGMEGPHQAIWGDASLGGWGGEESDRRTRDGSYTEDGGGMDYGYNNEMTHEKNRNSGWDKENGDWPDRHRRDERDGEWSRERYREKDRDSFRDQRDRDRDRDRDDDWERERSGRSRTKSRMVEDEDDDPRQRSRDDDYSRKRRMTDRDLS